jgi:hypothetical protein
MYFLQLAGLVHHGIVLLTLSAIRLEHLESRLELPGLELRSKLAEIWVVWPPHIENRAGLLLLKHSRLESRRHPHRGGECIGRFVIEGELVAPSAEEDAVAEKGIRSCSLVHCLRCIGGELIDAPFHGLLETGHKRWSLVKGWSELLFAALVMVTAFAFGVIAASAVAVTTAFMSRVIAAFALVMIPAFALAVITAFAFAVVAAFTLAVIPAFVPAMGTTVVSAAGMAAAVVAIGFSHLFQLHQADREIGTTAVPPPFLLLWRVRWFVIVMRTLAGGFVVRHHIVVALFLGGLFGMGFLIQ